MSLTAAIGQFAPGEDKNANVDTMVGLLKRAADLGAHLVVLPEFAVFTAPAMDDRFVHSAEPLDGPVASRLSELADEAVLVAGMFETAPDRGRCRHHSWQPLVDPT